MKRYLPAFAGGFILAHGPFLIKGGIIVAFTVLATVSLGRYWRRIGREEQVDG